MSNFSERLKELIDEKEIAPTELAEALNINRTTVSRYINGNRLPGFETFVKITEYFNCSADYLLGLTEIPPEIKHFNEVPPFSERFRYILKLSGKSQYWLEKEKKFSSTNLYNWLFGIKLPSVESLIDISKVFGYPIDFILGRID